MSARSATGVTALRSRPGGTVAVVALPVGGCSGDTVDAASRKEFARVVVDSRSHALRTDRAGSVTRLSKGGAFEVTMREDAPRRTLLGFQVRT
jgi:hypothetical protein